MKFFKQLFNFYIQGSIHVALSCTALVLMTQHMFHITGNKPIVFFAFFGTIAGYNFVKYDALARNKRKFTNNSLKAIIVLSFIAFLAAAYFFFQLKAVTKIVSAVFFGLLLLYTLPFFPNKKNARNWAGIKIYMVSLCWVGVTVIMPLIDAEIPLFYDVFLKCIQRFLLIFVLILIFEIIDLRTDDPHLHTVPQQIGVKKTKILGLLLLFPLFLLEFLRVAPDPRQIPINFALVLITGLFLAFADERKSKHYSTFWAESIPVFWWILMLLFG